jgi:rSAM/selenodomain-associated transferase 1
MNNALIIFTKNPVYGKVKTRLAATVGKKKALEIYTGLISHTVLITKKFSGNKIVFYSDEIISDDVWKNGYKKHLQFGNDLGERMKNAFDFIFKSKYDKAVIIGTDCPELNEEIIINAFIQLNKNDIVIGPAADGGYYLLGMKKNQHQLFENIEWSTDNVFKTTINLCIQNNLDFYLLPTLHDVDEEKDLIYLNLIHI